MSERLIPAHAGKTHCWRVLQCRRAAHPRSRGENSCDGLIVKREVGSSPLTRGKLEEGELSALITRLIPAHAGKTPWSPRRTSGGRAHPRSRGENCKDNDRAEGGCGSSPLTRGKQRIRPAHLSGAGLIPAHAGKTCRFPGVARRYRAHPRSRGENEVKGLGHEIGDGSSPLTRGKRRRKRSHRD